MGKNLVDEAIRLIKGNPSSCDNKPFRENESPRPVAGPDPAPIIIQEPSPATLDDRLMAMYTAKLEDIAGQYQDGAQEWLQQARPETYEALTLADDLVNQTWLDGLDGGATFADFEQAVNTWYDLELEVIQLYRDSLPKPESKPEVKQAIPACYCCHEYRWWVDYDGRKICAACHPPAKEKMVKEWLYGEVRLI